MHGNLHYYVRSQMVYAKQVMMLAHLLALVAIIFTPNNVYLYIYSNLALTCISDMLQTFDNDHVTLTPFSRAFKYIFSKLDSDHIFGLLNIVPHLDPASRLHILCK